ncbi:MAG TPA: CGNR zinc finger domain-containing protein [Candidatus Dormibacteraeota bacterium]
MSVVGDLAIKRPPAPPPLDLVEAFINTLDLETGSDDLATTSALRGWLLDRHLIKKADAVSDRDREQAISLREALRRAALANNSKAVDRRTIRELNQLASDARMVVAFGDDGVARLDPSVKGVQAGLARILSAVFVAMLTGGWTRLKSCANDGCHWAFYDASKNRSGRWCEMADCGNEAKGRTYRARRRSEVGSRSGSG